MYIYVYTYMKITRKYTKILSSQGEILSNFYAFLYFSIFYTLYFYDEQTGSQLSLF